MAETTIYAEQDGGGISRGANPADWETLFAITASGASNYSTATAHKVALDGTYYEIYQLLFRFDTSDLSGATINDVTLELTTNAWGAGGWNGAAAGAIEAYVLDSDVIADGYARSDLISTAEAASLYSGGNLAATSPYDAGGSATGYVRDWEFVSDADFTDLVNDSGYTCMALIPSNWRTETEASQAWRDIFTQHHATEAYRPRLVIDYTEGGGGISIPVVRHHLQMQGIA